MATTGNDDNNNNASSGRRGEGGGTPLGGGQMTMAFSTKKQSKTSTVTITGTYVCFFFQFFSFPVHETLSRFLVHVVERGVFFDHRSRVDTTQRSLFSLCSLALSFSSSQGNTNTSSPGTLCSKASGTANRSRRIDLPSEATNGSSCFTQTGNKRKIRKRRNKRRRKIRIARYSWR